MKFLIAIVLYRIERKLTPLLKQNYLLKKKKREKWQTMTCMTMLSTGNEVLNSIGKGHF
jgi:hypothetical protein